MQAGSDVTKIMISVTVWPKLLLCIYAVTCTFLLVPPSQPHTPPSAAAELPDTFGNLKKLETLNLERNSLQALPESILNVKSLKTVNLSGNRLAALPAFLYALTRLDFADLSRNRISVLPPGIGGLHAVELNLNQNQISALPAEIAGCRRLKVLRVEENTLSLAGVPPTLLSDSTVSLLCVEGNVFAMRELQELPEYEQVCGCRDGVPVTA